MNITGPLREILLNNLSAATLTAGKIFPVVAPQTTEPPFVVFAIADNMPSDTKSGASTVDMIEVQCDTLANTYDKVQAIDEAIRNALDRYRGNVTVGATDFPIDGIRYLRTQDGFEPEPALYRRSSRYKVRLMRVPATIDSSIPSTQPNYTVLSLSAGEELEKNRAVILDDGAVIYFQPDDMTHKGRILGITRDAADIGASVRVQTAGVVTDAALSLSADAGLYVAADGVIISAKPATGISQFIGASLSSTSFFINPSPPVEL